jgi:hypothetical protein
VGLVVLVPHLSTNTLCSSTFFFLLFGLTQGSSKKLKIVVRCLPRAHAGSHDNQASALLKTYRRPPVRGGRRNKKTTTFLRTSLSEFFGALPHLGDGLEFQKKARNEWI